MTDCSSYGPYQNYHDTTHGYKILLCHSQPPTVDTIYESTGDSGRKSGVHPTTNDIIESDDRDDDQVFDDEFVHIGGDENTGEHWAAGEGRLSCLKFLLDQRAWVGDKTHSGSKILAGVGTKFCEDSILSSPSESCGEAWMAGGSTNSRIKIKECSISDLSATI